MWKTRVAVVVGLAMLVSCGQPAQQQAQADATHSPAVAVPVTPHPDPLSQLASNDPALAANKRLVFDFWRTVINGGHVEAIDTMMAESYTQHSPALPTGRAGIKQVFASIPRLEQVPELVSPPLVTSVGEGNLVVMALAEQMPDPAGGKYTTTHFNLFRVDNGRLAEHWHSVQTPPGPKALLPEEGGAQLITGASGADQRALLTATDPALAANKQLVFEKMRQGTAITDPVVAMVAERDLVVVVTKHEFPHPHHAGRTYTTAWFDMFRIANGRVVEHWDAALKTGTPAPVYGAEAQQGEKK